MRANLGVRALLLNRGFQVIQKGTAPGLVSCMASPRPRQIGNGTYLYTYDPFNRLVAVWDKSTNTLMAQYFYDSAGERAAAITYNASGTATAYTQYLRSGAAVIDEKTWALPGYTVTEKRTYITVGGAMAVTRQTGGGTTSYSYYATDHLGTVRCTLTTDSNGVEQSRTFHDFEPFGLEIPVRDTASTNTHRFTGQERDLATGNDYMHFRFYGSVMGRFYRPDNVMGSATNPQDWNLYSYVHGNPLNFNDPTGHLYMPPNRNGLKLQAAAGHGNGTALGAAMDLATRIMEGLAQARALIARLQQGSLHLSDSFKKALYNSDAFRKGVEDWLGRKVGQRQVAMYQNDTNTIYTLNEGPLPHGATNPYATGETVGTGTESKVGPNQTIENTSVEITIDMTRIEAVLYNPEATDDELVAARAKRVTYDLGHEGFHAHDLASGLITQRGCFRRKALLDESKFDPRDRAWREELGL